MVLAIKGTGTTGLWDGRKLVAISQRGQWASLSRRLNVALDLITMLKQLHFP